MLPDRNSLLPLTVLIGLCLSAAFAHAQSGEDAGTPSTETAVPIPASLLSPRATMQTFLDAMLGVREDRAGALEQAVSTLNLDHVNALVRDEKGAETAWLLHQVIERTRTPNTSKMSSRKRGEPYVWNSYDDGTVTIAFDNDIGWRFSSNTVAALPAILDRLLAEQKASGENVTETYLPLHLRLRQHIPAGMRGTSFILEQWQWIGLLTIILVGLIADKLLSMLLRYAARYWRSRVALGAFRKLDDGILRPLGLMAMALIWWAGLNLLSLPAGALVILLVSVKFLACLSAVWGAYRLVDVVAAFLEDRALATTSKVDDALVPLVTKTMKLFVTVMGVVFIADNLDIDVTSVLAGLGLGGLAFALAAKDVAGNLFGSITVLLDQTFHVGDWIVIGDVEGAVERIGFRSTRIRTFYNSLVSVPNATFITANVDNMGARTYRRLSCKFGIAYNTPTDRIEAYCEGLRELVRQHPYMRKDNFHIYLNGFAASSLEILVYVFWLTPDWATELRERHRFLLDALRLAEHLGVEYAFPTQTLYMKQSDDALLPTAEDLYVATVDDAQARARGREQAKNIVDATLGLGVVPPPVGSTMPVRDNE